ncbi:GntR family transcriptional regulator [Actinobacteria bacterium YIM 96077]|uniref:GntR family transcriptional regulator n=1 Tax=Phytoactinopolyspora halophila TaxID=1981511 RepID=A0A329QYJ5_9ACTN|nr:winged helix-turn-helix domain-containing protein [Phytoactinopolyspora halophila]AYY15558.1 GntR family transcriptional regulator [Actinobacteria bacterium YIM 96077]RAW15718.1 GntR family transcriptional regulator [Phytoactinopolyspora halophila]
MRLSDFEPDQETAPRYLFEQVADHIERVIRHAAELRPGAMLPGEADLALALAVSIGTVRRATDVLRRRGVLVTLPAKGTFVATGGGE